MLPVLRPSQGIILVLDMLFLLPFRLTGATLLETTLYAEPIDYGECSSLDFQPPKYVTCACLDGIWALKNPTNDGQSEWKIIRSNNTCFHLNEWVSFAQKIEGFDNTFPLVSSANQSSTSSLFKILGHNDAVVIDRRTSQDWEVESSRNAKKCFKAPPTPASPDLHYCHYTLQHGPIQAVTKGCHPGVKMIKPTECRRLDQDFDEKVADLHGVSGCVLVPPPEIKNKRENLRKEENLKKLKQQVNATTSKHRVKRQANNSQEDSDEASTDIFGGVDTDAMRDISKIKGHPDLKPIVQQYLMEAVEKKIVEAEMAAVDPEHRAPKKRAYKGRPESPAQHLLELCMLISQVLQPFCCNNCTKMCKFYKIPKSVQMSADSQFFAQVTQLRFVYCSASAPSWIPTPLKSQSKLLSKFKMPTTTSKSLTLSTAITKVQSRL